MINKSKTQYDDHLEERAYHLDNTCCMFNLTMMMNMCHSPLSLSKESLSNSLSNGVLHKFLLCPSFVCLTLIKSG